MTNKKKQSSPIATGGGGHHFESHVQASFVVLMLTGGYAPCLPCWPIVEIKLQGKIDGYDTDDIIVFAEEPNSGQQSKLIGQIKRSITITKSDRQFGEVIQAAWNDFKNPKIFTPKADVIALITGPLSTTDSKNVLWLLNQARRTKNVSDFFRDVEMANFSPPQCLQKLKVIQHHLRVANSDRDVSRDELYNFLKHFYILSYDLGNEFGVVLSLLHSHISQFHEKYPDWIWPTAVDTVQNFNQSAGTITRSNLPDSLTKAFENVPVVQIPEVLKTTQNEPRLDWAQHPDSTSLAMVLLLGSWQDNNENDCAAVSQLLGINYDEWINKAREILHSADSPLSLNNGVWKVVNRAQLWSILGYRLLDQDLENFRSIVISILKEPDPSLELPADKRHTALSRGDELAYSRTLREGISEGLAILGSHSEACTYCSLGKAKAISSSIIRELLLNTDWISWSSLNDLLPNLAESAPDEFLDAVEQAMQQSPSPFDTLFRQEIDGFTGANYLTGTLWALEAIAWEDSHLIRVCVALAELASRDPGGRGGNRPSNSLLTILLPWFPQTLAPAKKRKAAVEKILEEFPDIGWNLIIQLLPGQHQTSSGSYKPRWRKTIPDNFEGTVTQQEFRTQASFHADLAVDAVGRDTERLCVLIENFENLPRLAFSKVLRVLSSQWIKKLSEEDRIPVWKHLISLTNKHKRYSNAEWALPGNIITPIDDIAKQLAPTEALNLYEPLFSDKDFELYEEDGDWQDQQKKLNKRREAAVLEIIQKHGVLGIVKFAESVTSPKMVGHFLGDVDNHDIEQKLLPDFLNSTNNNLKSLSSGYVWRRHHLQGWGWSDSLDKSKWTREQIGQFLAFLPFTSATWARCAEWLGEHREEYWHRAQVNPYQIEGDITLAVNQLIKYGRPHAALDCLNVTRHAKKSINTNLCVKALLAAPSSSEPTHVMSIYNIVELIKYLQKVDDISDEDLLAIEWAYVPLLDSHNKAAPRLLENKLANNPDFFCEVIRLLYRPKHQERAAKIHSEKHQAKVMNAWRLLRNWNMVPGTTHDGGFDHQLFNEWFDRVQESCSNSGHLEVALINIGKVLINAPADTDGLWIDKAVAKALDGREMRDLREGYSTGLFNSRGAHWVDPTGRPEKELADSFRTKAEEVETAGFYRLAKSLRDLADSYDEQAEQIVARHKDSEG